LRFNKKAEKPAIEADKDSLHEKKAEKTFYGLAMDMHRILDGRGCSA